MKKFQLLGYNAYGVSGDLMLVKGHKNIVQASRHEGMKDLGYTWYCYGPDVNVKTLDDARKIAGELGYDGILL